MDGTWKDVLEGLWSVIRPFFDMMNSGGSDETFFVVGRRDEWDISSISGLILVTMVFGGIHCIAWSFAFPSSTEQLLWRISSIAITGIPLAFIGVVFIVDQLDDDNPVKHHPRHHPFSTRLSSIPFPESCCWCCPLRLCGLFLPRRTRRCNGRLLFLTSNIHCTYFIIQPRCSSLHIHCQLKQIDSLVLVRPVHLAIVQCLQHGIALSQSTRL